MDWKQKVTGLHRLLWLIFLACLINLFPTASIETDNLEPVRILFFYFTRKEIDAMDGVAVKRILLISQLGSQVGQHNKKIHCFSPLFNWFQSGFYRWAKSNAINSGCLRAIELNENSENAKGVTTTTGRQALQRFPFVVSSSAMMLLYCCFSTSLQDTSLRIFAPVYSGA